MNVLCLSNRCKAGQGVLLLSATVFFLAGISITANADAEQLDRQKIISQVVENWIAVAQRQYERFMFVQAEKSLTRAEQYHDHLSSKQKDVIDELVNKVHNAMLTKKQQLEQIDAANELARRGQLLKAKAHLEQVNKSNLLNTAEKQSLTLTLKRLNAQLDLRKREMAELFKESKRYYIAGELEKARDGFIEVAASGLYVPSKSMTAEQYLQKIDELTMAEAEPIGSAAEPETKSKSLLWFWGREKDKKSQETSQPGITDIIKPVAVSKTKTIDAGKPQANSYQQASPVDTADSIAIKSNVKHSYLRAVVNDAQVKVARYLGKGEFGQAKIVAENARITLERYRSDISRGLFRQLAAELDGLSRMIMRRQSQ